ncbi:hypothetical protein KC799_16380 [candidate division KSB1 bacterium]|nr:hypothetical protein [candidate division KSB1 bacterium]
MSKIKTVASSGVIDTRVKWSDNEYYRIRIDRGDAALDQHGNIRALTLRDPNDYSYYQHLVLMPKSKLGRAVSEFVNNWLIPIGVSFSSGEFYKGRTRYESFGQALFEQNQTVLMQDLFDRVTIGSSVYCDIASEEPAIISPCPIRVELTSYQKQKFGIY